MEDSVEFLPETPAINRPLIFKRGWPGTVEVNKVEAYLGAWVVFKFPLDSGAMVEVRMPAEDALEERLIDSFETMQYIPQDSEE